MSATQSDRSTVKQQVPDNQTSRAKQLAALRGIGDVLARRLVEMGHDTVAKVAALGEDGLKQVAGINQRLVPGIIRQAEELTREARQGKTAAVDEMKARVAALKTRVQDLAQATRTRFGDELSGPVGAKLEKEFCKALTSLENVEAKLKGRVKKAGKGLRKAEKRLGGLADASLKKMGKGLKRARKSLKKVYAS
jgi:hypothetical protein